MSISDFTLKERVIISFVWTFDVAYVHKGQLAMVEETSQVTAAYYVSRIKLMY